MIMTTAGDWQLTGAGREALKHRGTILRLNPDLWVKMKLLRLLDDEEMDYSIFVHHAQNLIELLEDGFIEHK